MDWRNAKLDEQLDLDAFNANRMKYAQRDGELDRYGLCIGTLSEKLSDLTFDFTQSLPHDWVPLHDESDVRVFLQQNYNEKLSRIGQTLNNDAGTIDYYIPLVSNSGEVVTIVMLNTRNTSLQLSNATVAFNSIQDLSRNARKRTAAHGVPKDTILCVAELWSINPLVDTISPPIRLKNTVMQRQKKLQLLAAPLMCDLFEFVVLDL